MTTCPGAEPTAPAVTVARVDAFERLVSDARDQLSATEGQVVSWREIVRRAGFDDVDFGRVSYHLLPRTRTRGHHVPAWLIDRLVGVLPVSRLELNRAAAEAAGYEVTDGQGAAGTEAEQLVPMVTRVLGDKELTPEQRRRLRDEVLAVIVWAQQREAER